MTARNSLSLLALVIASALVLPDADAGFRYTLRSVVVNTSARMAYGSMGGARMSADGEQTVSCMLSASTSWRQAECTLTNAAGTDAYCWTDNERMVNTIASLDGDDWIHVQWDAAGKCIVVFAIRSSANELRS